MKPRAWSTDPSQTFLDQVTMCLVDCVASICEERSVHTFKKQDFETTCRDINTWMKDEYGSTLSHWVFDLIERYGLGNKDMLYVEKSSDGYTLRVLESHLHTFCYDYALKKLTRPKAHS